jgi:hypothetical protein
LEVRSVVLGNLDVEEGNRQLPIARGQVGQRLGGPLRASEVRSERICAAAADKPSGDQSGSRPSCPWTPVNVALTGRSR